MRIFAVVLVTIFSLVCFAGKSNKRDMPDHRPQSEEPLVGPDGAIDSGDDGEIVGPDGERGDYYTGEDCEYVLF